MASFSSLTRAALLALVPFCIGPGFCASPRALRASIAGAGTHQTREHYLHTSSCHLREQRAVRSAQGRRARGRQARSSGAHPRRTCERTCWSILAVNLGVIGIRSGLGLGSVGKSQVGENSRRLALLPAWHCRHCRQARALRNAHNLLAQYDHRVSRDRGDGARSADSSSARSQMLAVSDDEAGGRNEGPPSCRWTGICGCGRCGLHEARQRHRGGRRQ